MVIKVIERMPALFMERAEAFCLSADSQLAAKGLLFAVCPESFVLVSGI